MNQLTLVYALEEPPQTYSKSLFLAGPTPRDARAKSFRPEAIELLARAGYDGVVYIPETRSGVWHGDRVAQIEWEHYCLDLSDGIMFWVPRDMDTMPALTTNVEFGRWEDSGRVVLGAPKTAVRNEYLFHYADKLDIPTATTLEETVELALDKLGVGAVRTAGERAIPLCIWRLKSFQQWYAGLRSNGDQLVHAKVLWTHRVGPNRMVVDHWALHVDIWVANGNREMNKVVLV